LKRSLPGCHPLIGSLPVITALNDVLRSSRHTNPW
jgi:hypothetical protein